MASFPITLEWSAHILSSLVKSECLSLCTVTGVSGSCVVNITDTQDEIYYRCTASHLVLTNFSDIFNLGIISLYFR